MQTQSSSMTLRALGLEQYISGPTHVKGNTLDVIFTQISNSFDISNITLHGFISDHCMVSVDINRNIQKYPNETKKRDKTKITGPTLAQNITPQEFNEDTPTDEASIQFTTELLKELDAIATIKSIKITNRPKQSWFNKFIREQRRVVKNYGRSWRKYKHHHQWQACMKDRNVHNRPLIYHKKQTISKKINESKNYTKQLPPYQHYHMENTQSHARRKNGCTTSRNFLYCFL